MPLGVSVPMQKGSAYDKVVHFWPSSKGVGYFFTIFVPVYLISADAKRITAPAASACAHAVVVFAFFVKIT